MSQTLTGAEIVVRCLAEEKVDFVFGYPGGAVLNIYDRFSNRTSSSTCWFGMSRQPYTQQTRIRARHATHWRMSGHQRPRRHQRGDRHCHRVHGLDPDGHHQRSGADPCHRTGRVFRSAIRLASRALREAQLPGQDVKDLASTMNKRLSSSRHRSPRPGAGRHPQGCDHEQLLVRVPERSGHAQHNPTGKGHSGQIKKAVQLLLDASAR